MIKTYYLGVLSAAAIAAACGADAEPYAQADQALADAGEVLEGEGVCAALDQVEEDCPSDLDWRNHGQYVSCVAKYVAARVKNGDLTEEDGEALVQIAAQSDVGMPPQAGGPDRPGGGKPDFDGHFPGDTCSGND